MRTGRDLRPLHFAIVNRRLTARTSDAWLARRPPLSLERPGRSTGAAFGVPEPALSPRVSLIVVAAGRGARLGGAIPKQYLPCAGRPLICHTIEALTLAHEFLAATVVVGPRRSRSLRHGRGYARLLPTAALLLTTPLFGGATRQRSVRNGLESNTFAAAASRRRIAAQALSDLSSLFRLSLTELESLNFPAPAAQFLFTGKARRGRSETRTDGRTERRDPHLCRRIPSSSARFSTRRRSCGCWATSSWLGRRSPSWAHVTNAVWHWDGGSTGA